MRTAAYRVNAAVHCFHRRNSFYKKLVFIQLHTGPGFHMIEHLSVRLNIDTAHTLLQRNHDCIHFCVRIAGSEVLALFRVVRIEPGRALRCNDLSLPDIERGDIFSLLLAVNGSNINIVV